MDIDPAVMKSLITIVLLLILSAYFSATETAYTSLNKVRIKSLANNKNKKAKEVLALNENYDKLLSTILVGNNIVNIALTAISTLMFVNLLGKDGSLVSTIAVTIVVLIFGEISPKALAKENSEKFALSTVGILKLFVIILTPINFVFSAWKNFLIKIFKIKGDNLITEDELLMVIEDAKNEGSIGKDQSELIQNAIEFNDLDAWDVLKPRVEMVAIELTEDNDKIAKIFKDTGYSRLPVYDDNLDKMLGVLNQKDFYNYVQGKNCSIKEFLKPVVFSPGSIKISTLLKRMQNSKTHMSIVVDEYGGTAGLVTMEDIIEELVGEIYDEHDIIDQRELVKLSNGNIKVMGHTNIEKVFEYYNINEDMEVITVNGFISLNLDKLPEVGDRCICTIDNKEIVFEVIKADKKKAIEVEVSIKKTNIE